MPRYAFFNFLLSLARATPVRHTFRRTFAFCLLSFVIFHLSCQRATEPLPGLGTIQLTVEDVSCTEAWLGLTTDNTDITDKDRVQLTLRLYREDSVVVSKLFTADDMLLYDAGLQPAASYRYRAELVEGTRAVAKSVTVTATTMDTTSHDFEWQSWEFGGQGGSSSFYDVAIIDENDIWAVGEIYTTDDTYNAAHWDGEKWELKKITYGGWFWTINTVFAFSHNDVWFSAFVKWNGNKFVEYPVPDVLTGYGLNKIWGTSSSNLYVVGNNGLIAHYDGQEWRRIESGTDENIQDIWGGIDNKTGKPYILCAASQVYTNSNKLVLDIQQDTVKRVNWPFNDRKPYSVWFKNRKRVFACGDGIFTKEVNRKWRLFYDEIPYFMNRIRGIDINNIYVVGAFGLIAHFNGISWKTLPTKLYGSYVSVDIKDNMVVTVGYENRPALLTMIWMSD